MRREGKQASFAEALVAGGGNRRLEAIEVLVDWAAVEKLLAPVYAAPTGRASYPVLSLFKAVLLGAWHGLGDPELEAALGDRLSFRRFADWRWTSRSPITRPCGGSAISCGSGVWRSGCSRR